MPTLNLRDWLQLSHIPGLGPKTYLHLLRRFGNDPHNILAAKPIDLTNAGVSETLARQIHTQSSDLTAADFAWLDADSQHHIITLQDRAYPQLLREISAPPPLLYVKGDAALLSSQPCLAMVGSRKATTLGSQTAFRFSKQLSMLGITIVSGLAIGIDGQAHRGALATDTGRTIAVLANGLDTIYPFRHTLLSTEIVSRGVLVTEFPPWTNPLPQNFPRRNRIISGLCIGTIIVEAAPKSGSLITARYALEQNREVFALPGPIHSRHSEGCHRLIQDGAKLVTGIEDILLECPQICGLLNSDRGGTSSLDESSLNAGKLLKFIEFVPMPIDTLIEKSGLTPDQVSSMLIELEISGHITSDGNGLYSRSALE